MVPIRRRHILISAALFLYPLFAPAADQSGTFILHKFARAIGRESYSISHVNGAYTLTSHFKFTDRGSDVPLETSFSAQERDMIPLSYTSLGKVSRFSPIDDRLSVKDGNLVLTRGGKDKTLPASQPWFIVDGYSPVAMQEQMMRWWSQHGQPAGFTIFPMGTEVRIHPASPLRIGKVAMRGFTISGLIWGQECLWMDSANNLTALVGIDAEFDHFEAVREPYSKHLGEFIAAAAKADLAVLSALTQDAGSPAPSVLAITGATVEDVTGAPPIQNATILIERGKITACGPREKVSIPENATVLDATGKYAIPGLWDMHAHYEQVEWGPIYLAAGVTSVRDAGNEFDFIRVLHDDLDRTDHPAIGPHLEFAGIIDGDGPLALGAVTASTPEQARDEVRRYKQAGARQIKIYSSVKPEIVKAITAEAHAEGLTVTGHVPNGMTALDAVNDGMDQINHIDFLTPYFSKSFKGSDGKPDRSKPLEPDVDGDRAKQLIAALQQHKTVLDPTMAIFELDSHSVPLNQLEPGVDHVAPQLKAGIENPPDTSERAIRGASIRLEALRRLHEAGIPIVAGTDQAVPGYSLHRELEIYVSAGFTPLQALQSASIEAARAVGVESESGSLEPGKRGDVVLLDADPLEDIHNTRKIWRTVAAGAVYDPTPLWKSVGFSM